MKMTSAPLVQHNNRVKNTALQWKQIIELNIGYLNRHPLMNIFVYKAVFNWGKGELMSLDLRENLEYGRRELGRWGLRQWWLSWISLKSLRSALLMSWEMRKPEWQRPRRFAFLKKTSSLHLSVSERSPAIAGVHTPPQTRLKRERLFVRNQRGALELYQLIMPPP